MASVNVEPRPAPVSPRSATLLLIAIAAAITLLHLLTNGRYGFHRDELQVLSDARHLDWGFVAYPPLTPFVERISLALFGTSLTGLRLFSVISQAAIVILSDLMARQLGGAPKAQVAAALAVALSPIEIFEGTEFQYSSFDLLWWVLIAYFAIRLLKSDDPRWCLAMGATLGLGFQTKYSIAFLFFGVIAGLIFTPARRYLASRWFWMGAALTVLIAMPNFLWQLHHGFISLHFLQHIHQRDIKWGRANGFLIDQLRVCANLFAAPLWIAGGIAFARSRRCRMIAWMYFVPLALFYFGKGRGYYMGGSYPALIAMGAVAGERWCATLSTGWRRTVERTVFTGIAVCGVIACAMLVPLASSGPLHDFALRSSGDLREEFGWEELVRQAASIRDSLPVAKQQSLGILVGNYGEQGAIELFGPAYNLPPPISMTNSAWLRGYPTPPPATIIVLGFDREDADKAFFNCGIAGHNDSGGINNEESRWDSDIFVCGAPRLGWPQFWKEYQSFG